MTDSDTKRCEKCDHLPPGHWTWCLLFKAPAEPAPVAQAAQVCGNCGHSNPHTSPAGDVADGCEEPGCSCGYYAPASSETDDDCPMCESNCPGGAHRNALHEAGITTKEQYRQACASEPVLKNPFDTMEWGDSKDSPMHPVATSEPEKPPIPDAVLYEEIARRCPEDRSPSEAMAKGYADRFFESQQNLAAALSQVAELTELKDWFNKRCQWYNDQLNTSESKIAELTRQLEAMRVSRDADVKKARVDALWEAHRTAIRYRDDPGELYEEVTLACGNIANDIAESIRASINSAEKLP